MKIGINTYLASDHACDGFLIGASDVELNEDQIVRVFGNTLKYNEIVKILKSSQSNNEELVVKKFGQVTIKIFNLEP